MENQLQHQNNQLTTKLEQSSDLSINSVTPKERELARQVYHVNQLTSFPLTVGQIADWAKSIAELAPQMEPEQLKFLIDLMKMGKYEYDTRKGIQNIFEAYNDYFGDRELVH